MSPHATCYMPTVTTTAITVSLSLPRASPAFAKEERIRRTHRSCQSHHSHRSSLFAATSNGVSPCKSTIAFPPCSRHVLAIRLACVVSGGSLSAEYSEASEASSPVAYERAGERAEWEGSDEWHWERRQRSSIWEGHMLSDRPSVCLAPRRGLT